MDSFSILLGKGIQKISKLRGGGGSALPGLFVEKTNPNFLRKTLSKLPYGVVVISGTNGKTTTTKIVSELLAKQGLKVFTNKTGSNFVRGAISAILEEIKVSGKFDYDIAVLGHDTNVGKLITTSPNLYGGFAYGVCHRLQRWPETGAGRAVIAQQVCLTL